MDRAKVFKNGGSQAVRIPKKFQFDSQEVYINKVGGIVMLIPPGEGWASLVASLDHFSKDFMQERDQGGAAEVRKPL